MFTFSQTSHSRDLLSAMFEGRIQHVWNPDVFITQVHGSFSLVAVCGGYHSFIIFFSTFMRVWMMFSDMCTLTKVIEEKDKYESQITKRFHIKMHRLGKSKIICFTAFPLLYISSVDLVQN